MTGIEGGSLDQSLQLFQRHARDFVDSLPPAYDKEEHKAQFRYFIEHYGTSFATTATLGGLVEQYTTWKTPITDPRLGGFTPATPGFVSTPKRTANGPRPSVFGHSRTPGTPGMKPRVSGSGAETWLVQDIDP